MTYHRQSASVNAINHTLFVIRYSYSHWWTAAPPFGFPRVIHMGFDDQIRSKLSTHVDEAHSITAPITN